MDINRGCDLVCRAVHELLLLCVGMCARHCSMEGSVLTQANCAPLSTAHWWLLLLSASHASVSSLRDRDHESKDCLQMSGLTARGFDSSQVAER